MAPDIEHDFFVLCMSWNIWQFFESNMNRLNWPFSSVEIILFLSDSSTNLVSPILLRTAPVYLVTE